MATDDPFETLRLHEDPIAPSPAFAASLKARVTSALGLAPVLKGTAMPRTAEGHSVVTAYICCRGAGEAMTFYADVFGAVQVGQAYVDQTDGRIGHAEFQIGDTRLMISDEYPDFGALSPLSLGGTSVAFSIYVDDVDESFRRCVAAGGTNLRPPEDQAYGARSGTMLDPWGHRWSVQTMLDTPAVAIEGFDLVDAPMQPGAPEYVMTPRAVALLNGPAQLGYFTMFTLDIARAAAFFGSLFGWSIEPGGHIANIDPPGGFAERAASSVGDAPVTLYFQVPDLDPVCTQVISLGGKVLSRATYTSGDNAECTDDQGLRFDLFKPIPGYERP